MTWRNLYDSVTFRIILLVTLTILGTWLFLEQNESWFICTLLVWMYALWLVKNAYKRNAEKVAFMFDAIDNSDYAFKYTTLARWSNDKMVNESLNRITRILFQAKADAVQQEKYYELIMNSIHTGFIVVDDNGYIYQTNKEALQILGLQVLTHVKQLKRVDEQLETLISQINPEEKSQISFQNERGTIHLSLRVSEITLKKKHMRIVAINDINHELDDKEIESWTRLTRVLTHEIMNSVTPITSLSETLLSMHGDANKEIRNGLEVISNTGKSLISFVESYRKFTHLPTPAPSLFFVQKFMEQIIRLTNYEVLYPNICIQLQVSSEDLILYADEKLIHQVVLNLTKNALQAIGTGQPDGIIEIHCYTNEEEVIIEVSNNGPLIPVEEAEHIFVPFFTTKEGGSGIGLSISRQIMRLSGGSLVLKSSPSTQRTTFVLTFP